MFIVTEAKAAAIRTAWHTGGELSAAVELRWLFPGIEGLTRARECARTIAAWTPPPAGARRELVEAMRAMAATGAAPPGQVPSIGKWKPGA